MWICSGAFNQIYKIDPATLNVTTYPGVDCHSIASGPDGNLWLLSGGIIRLTTTGQATTYSFPSGYSEAQHPGGRPRFHLRFRWKSLVRPRGANWRSDRELQPIDVHLHHRRPSEA